MAPSKVRLVAKVVAKTGGKPSKVTSTAKLKKETRELNKERVSALSTARKIKKLPSLAKGDKLDDDFYAAPSEELARRLLGQTLVRALPDGRRLAGRVVETESYLGGPDMASCTHNGRQTPSNMGLFMKPGTAYVYMTYGMYYCFNISSGGEGSAVLLRALEPLEGLEVMRDNRGAKRKDGGVSLKEKELCAGPSKLCMALGISKELLDQRDLVTSDAVWIERADDVDDAHIVAAPRVGIGARAGEWRYKPLRLYVRGSAGVSVRDVKAEGATM